METILTIDFDVIMWPSIELYNNKIQGDVDRMEEIEKGIPLLKYANADLELYQTLTNYLLKAKDNGSEFYFIDTHEKALNYITEPCALINIDHHHDLGYSKSQWEDKNLIACGNWVYRGIKDGKIKKYMWLCDFTSISPFNLQEDVGLIETCVNATNFDQLIIPKKIIICSSFMWIPTAIRPLYFLWEDLLERKE